MILGNKCDMSDKRVISKERGEAIAREHSIRLVNCLNQLTIILDCFGKSKRQCFGSGWIRVFFSLILTLKTRIRPFFYFNLL